MKALKQRFTLWYNRKSGRTCAVLLSDYCVGMFDLYPAFNLLLIDPKDDSLGAFRVPYLVFNSLEAVCWLAVSLAVIRRYWIHRKSPAEPSYALAFLAFAFSDVLETSGTSLLLLLFKAVCLLAILAFRQLIRPLYGSRAF